MKVHSALQEYLNVQRHSAGSDSFQLAQMSAYRSLYQVWCSKKRDRVLGAAADDEMEYRAAVVHTSFGRDPYVQGAEALLASESPQDAKLLSLYTGQVQMVARGDDLRGRKLKDLGTRTLACVGKSRQHIPCCRFNLAVLQQQSILLAAAAGTVPQYQPQLVSDYTTVTRDRLHCS